MTNAPEGQPTEQPAAAPEGPPAGQPPAQGEAKDWLVTLLLAILVGALGVHRFYVGKIGTGVLMLLTGGGCGIWYIIDIIMVATGSFKDAAGRDLVKK